ncbi:MAG: hypothetical protein OEY56_05665 [Cyclobacteriaceae bacterium]|nr:hypothetical protein [Cyclobacteriaceae bacterium]
MKKQLFFFALGLFCLSAAQAQITKAAVISVFGDKNLTDNPLDTKIYESVFKDSSFNISRTVNDFDKVVWQMIVPAFDFPFMAKEDVLSSPAYQALDTLVVFKKDLNPDKENKGTFWEFFNPIVPANGYVSITAFGALGTDKKAIQQAFQVFPELEAVMIAYVDFNLYDAMTTMGVTTQKINAYVNVKLFNSQGDRIFKLRERATSRKGAVAVGGLMLDTGKIMELIDDASAQLFADMEAKIPKSIAKMTKKINKNAGESDN